MNDSFISLGKTTAAGTQQFVSGSEGEEPKATSQKAGSKALEQVAPNRDASCYTNDIAVVTSVSLNSIAA